MEDRWNCSEHQTCAFTSENIDPTKEGCPIEQSSDLFQSSKDIGGISLSCPEHLDVKISENGFSKAPSRNSEIDSLCALESIDDPPTLPFPHPNGDCLQEQSQANSLQSDESLLSRSKCPENQDLQNSPSVNSYDEIKEHLPITPGHSRNVDEGGPSQKQVEIDWMLINVEDPVPTNSAKSIPETHKDVFDEYNIPGPSKPKIYHTILKRSHTNKHTCRDWKLINIEEPWDLSPESSVENVPSSKELCCHASISKQDSKKHVHFDPRSECNDFDLYEVELERDVPSNTNSTSECETRKPVKAIDDSKKIADFAFTEFSEEMLPSKLLYTSKVGGQKSITPGYKEKVKTGVMYRFNKNASANSDPDQKSPEDHGFKGSVNSEMKSTFQEEESETPSKQQQTYHRNDDSSMSDLKNDNGSGSQSQAEDKNAMNYGNEQETVFKATEKKTQNYTEKMVALFTSLQNQKTSPVPLTEKFRRRKLPEGLVANHVRDFDDKKARTAEGTYINHETERTTSSQSSLAGSSHLYLSSRLPRALNVDKQKKEEMPENNKQSVEAILLVLQSMQDILVRMAKMGSLPGTKGRANDESEITDILKSLFKSRHAKNLPFKMGCLSDKEVMPDGLIAYSIAHQVIGQAFKKISELYPESAIHIQAESYRETCLKDEHSISTLMALTAMKDVLRDLEGTKDEKCFISTAVETSESLVGIEIAKHIEEQSNGSQGCDTGDIIQNLLCEMFETVTRDREVSKASVHNYHLESLPSFLEPDHIDSLQTELKQMSFELVSRTVKEAVNALINTHFDIDGSSCSHNETRDVILPTKTTKEKAETNTKVNTDLPLGILETSNQGHELSVAYFVQSISGEVRGLISRLFNHLQSADFRDELKGILSDTDAESGIDIEKQMDNESDNTSESFGGVSVTTDAKDQPAYIAIARKPPKSPGTQENGSTSVILSTDSGSDVQHVRNIPTKNPAKSLLIRKDTTNCTTSFNNPWCTTSVSPVSDKDNPKAQDISLPDAVEKPIDKDSTESILTGEMCGSNDSTKCVNYSSQTTDSSIERLFAMSSEITSQSQITSTNSAMQDTESQELFEYSTPSALLGLRTNNGSREDITIGSTGFGNLHLIGSSDLLVVPPGRIQMMGGNHPEHVQIADQNRPSCSVSPRTHGTQHDKQASKNLVTSKSVTEGGEKRGCANTTCPAPCHHQPRAAKLIYNIPKNKHSLSEPQLDFYKRTQVLEYPKARKQLIDSPESTNSEWTVTSYYPRRPFSFFENDSSDFEDEDVYTVEFGEGVTQTEAEIILGIMAASLQRDAGNGPPRTISASVDGTGHQATQAATESSYGYNRDGIVFDQPISGRTGRTMHTYRNSQERTAYRDDGAQADTYSSLRSGRENPLPYTPEGSERILDSRECFRSDEGLQSIKPSSGHAQCSDNILPCDCAECRSAVTSVASNVCPNCLQAMIFPPKHTTYRCHQCGTADPAIDAREKTSDPSHICTICHKPSTFIPSPYCSRSSESASASPRNMSTTTSANSISAAFDSQDCRGRTSSQSIISDSRENFKFCHNNGQKMGSCSRQNSCSSMDRIMESKSTSFDRGGVSTQGQAEMRCREDKPTSSRSTSDNEEMPGGEMHICHERGRQASRTLHENKNRNINGNGRRRQCSQHSSDSFITPRGIEQLRERMKHGMEEIQSTISSLCSAVHHNHADICHKAEAMENCRSSPDLLDCRCPLSTRGEPPAEPGPATCPYTPGPESCSLYRAEDLKRQPSTSVDESPAFCPSHTSVTSARTMNQRLSLSVSRRKTAHCFGEARTEREPAATNVCCPHSSHWNTQQRELDCQICSESCVDNKQACLNECTCHTQNKDFREVITSNTPACGRHEIKRSTSCCVDGVFGNDSVDCRTHGNIPPRRACSSVENCRDDGSVYGEALSETRVSSLDKAIQCTECSQKCNLHDGGLISFSEEKNVPKKQTGIDINERADVHSNDLSYISRITVSRRKDQHEGENQVFGGRSQANEDNTLFRKRSSTIASNKMKSRNLSSSIQVISSDVDNAIVVCNPPSRVIATNIDDFSRPKAGSRELDLTSKHDTQTQSELALTTEESLSAQSYQDIGSLSSTEDACSVSSTGDLIKKPCRDMWSRYEVGTRNGKQGSSEQRNPGSRTQSQTDAITVDACVQTFDIMCSNFEVLSDLISSDITCNVVVSCKDQVDIETCKDTDPPVETISDGGLHLEADKKRSEQEKESSLGHVGNNDTSPAFMLPQADAVAEWVYKSSEDSFLTSVADQSQLTEAFNSQASVSVFIDMEKGACEAMGDSVDCQIAPESGVGASVDPGHSDRDVYFASVDKGDPTGQEQEQDFQAASSDSFPTVVSTASSLIEGVFEVSHSQCETCRKNEEVCGYSGNLVPSVISPAPVDSPELNTTCRSKPDRESVTSAEEQCTCTVASCLHSLSPDSDNGYATCSVTSVISNKTVIASPPSSTRDVEIPRLTDAIHTINPLTLSNGIDTGVDASSVEDVSRASHTLNYCEDISNVDAVCQLGNFEADEVSGVDATTRHYQISEHLDFSFDDSIFDTTFQGDVDTAEISNVDTPRNPDHSDNGGICNVDAAKGSNTIDYEHYNVDIFKNCHQVQSEKYESLQDPIPDFLETDAENITIGYNELDALINDTANICREDGTDEVSCVNVNEICITEKNEYEEVCNIISTEACQAENSIVDEVSDVFKACQLGNDTDETYNVDSVGVSNTGDINGIVADTLTLSPAVVSISDSVDIGSKSSTVPIFNVDRDVGALVDPESDSDLNKDAEVQNQGRERSSQQKYVGTKTFQDSGLNDAVKILVSADVHNPQIPASGPESISDVDAPPDYLLSTFRFYVGPSEDDDHVLCIADVDPTSTYQGCNVDMTDYSIDPDEQSAYQVQRIVEQCAATDNDFTSFGDADDCHLQTVRRSKSTAVDNQNENSPPKQQCSDVEESCGSSSAANPHCSFEQEFSVDWLVNQEQPSFFDYCSLSSDNSAIGFSPTSSATDLDPASSHVDPFIAICNPLWFEPTHCSDSATSEPGCSRTKTSSELGTSVSEAGVDRGCVDGPRRRRELQESELATAAMSSCVDGVVALARSQSEKGPLNTRTQSSLDSWASLQRLNINSRATRMAIENRLKSLQEILQRMEKCEDLASPDCDTQCHDQRPQVSQSSDNASSQTAASPAENWLVNCSSNELLQILQRQLKTLKGIATTETEVEKSHQNTNTNHECMDAFTNTSSPMTASVGTSTKRPDSSHVTFTDHFQPHFTMTKGINAQSPNFSAEAERSTRLFCVQQYANGKGDGANSQNMVDYFTNSIQLGRYANKGTGIDVSGVQTDSMDFSDQPQKRNFADSFNAVRTDQKGISADTKNTSAQKLNFTNSFSVIKTVIREISTDTMHIPSIEARSVRKGNMEENDPRSHVNDVSESKEAASSTRVHSYDAEAHRLEKSHRSCCVDFESDGSDFKVHCTCTFGKSNRHQLDTNNAIDNTVTNDSNEQCCESRSTNSYVSTETCYTDTDSDSENFAVTNLDSSLDLQTERTNLKVSPVDKNGMYATASEDHLTVSDVNKGNTNTVIVGVGNADVTPSLTNSDVTTSDPDPCTAVITTANSASSNPLSTKVVKSHETVVAKTDTDACISTHVTTENMNSDIATRVNFCVTGVSSDNTINDIDSCTISTSLNDNTASGDTKNGISTTLVKRETTSNAVSSSATKMTRDSGLCTLVVDSNSAAFPDQHTFAAVGASGLMTDSAATISLPGCVRRNDEVQRQEDNGMEDEKQEQKNVDANESNTSMDKECDFGGNKEDGTRMKDDTEVNNATSVSPVSVVQESFCAEADNYTKNSQETTISSFSTNSKLTDASELEEKIAPLRSSVSTAKGNRDTVVFKTGEKRLAYTSPLSVLPKGSVASGARRSPYRTTPRSSFTLTERPLVEGICLKNFNAGSVDRVRQTNRGMTTFTTSCMEAGHATRGSLTTFSDDSSVDREHYGIASHQKASSTPESPKYIEERARLQKGGKYREAVEKGSVGCFTGRGAEDRANRTAAGDVAKKGSGTCAVGVQCDILLESWVPNSTASSTTPDSASESDSQLSFDSAAGSSQHRIRPHSDEGLYLRDLHTQLSLLKQYRRQVLNLQEDLRLEKDLHRITRSSLEALRHDHTCFRSRLFTLHEEKKKKASERLSEIFRHTDGSPSGEKSKSTAQGGQKKSRVWGSQSTRLASPNSRDWLRARND